MYNVSVLYIVEQGLIVEEVKHVLDGERQRGAAVDRAEDPLKQVVYKLL